MTHLDLATDRVGKGDGELAAEVLPKLLEPFEDRQLAGRSPLSHLGVPEAESGVGEPPQDP